MADRDRIVEALTALLRPEDYRDYGPNGLQVPGRQEVCRIVSGVSANRALIEAAAAQDADLLLVHHGLFWGERGPIDPVLAGRLRLLFAHEINLVAYHLPLDGHGELGNNALLADALGLTDRRRFAHHGGQPIGVCGRLPGEGLLPEELAARAGEIARPPVAFLHGADRIRTVGIVSGGGADDVHEAAQLGLDALLTGEPEERSQAVAEELGMHLIAAGHHATERLGVQALGEWLAGEFGLAHTFVDIDNPV